MNYLKELNAFYQQIIFNPLSGSAVALWNTLMHFNNLSGWQETFSVPASVIELKSGIKGTSFKRARIELQEKGYITVTSRDGNQSAVYQMISQVKPMYQVNSTPQTIEIQQPDHSETHLHVQTMLSQPEQQSNITKQEAATPYTYTDTTQQPLGEPTEQQIAGQLMDHLQENNTIHRTNHAPDNNPGRSMDQSAAGNVNHKADHSTAPLIKQNKDKNENKAKHNPTTTTTSDAIRFFQENFGVASSYVADDITNRVNDLGDPLVLDAMKRALEQNKATWRYVKGILKAWARKGITTVEQAAADETAFRNRQNSKSTQSAATTDDVVPEWFNERKRKQALDKKRKQHEGPKVMSDAEEEEFEKLLAEYNIKKSAAQ
ncbi:DnaD domain-containing protein [Lentibacillus salinarum]|uniref:DnaD domain-containing protein n=1 Tax=Lentibacillus salinarum TaxID=446820 RepID=A0ABW3ZY21_9BACI